jgi:uncharacterized membrane protein (TIGR02234 family)
MRARLAVATVTAGAGALLVLFAAGRGWGAATVVGVTRQHVSVTGRQVAPSLPALAGAGVALAVATFAARGLLRRLVALVGVVVSAATAGVAGTAHGDVGRSLAAHAFGVTARTLHAPANGWWLCAAVGGAVSAVAFATVVVAGHRWSGLGTRYDAPGTPARRRDPAAEAWDALDRGDDPTT